MESPKTNAIIEGKFITLNLKKGRGLVLRKRSDCLPNPQIFSAPTTAVRRPLGGHQAPRDVPGGDEVRPLRRVRLQGSHGGAAHQLHAGSSHAEGSA